MLLLMTVVGVQAQTANDEFTKDSKAIVFHDMSMHVGFEISESVEQKNLEHILDQAENRRHAEKAVMYTLINS